MGDTAHIDGTKDVEGWKEGDHEHNAGLLALHEYEHVRHFFPEIDGLHLSGDSSTIVDDAGAPVSDQTLRDLLVGERHPKRLGIGETTLRRAIVTGQEAAQGRLESESETSGRLHGERRIHPGAVENFAPDSGSSAEGIDPPKHALDGISYSIGSENEPSYQREPEQPSKAPDSERFPGAEILEEEHLFNFDYPRKFSQISPSLAAYLSDDGTVTFGIKTPAEGSPVRGAEMFDRMMSHFGERVKAIRGEWYCDDPSDADPRSNIHTANSLTSSGASVEDAAKSTFTGKMAAKYGFTSTTLVEKRGTPGKYTKIIVAFKKP